MTEDEIEEIVDALYDEISERIEPPMTLQSALDVVQSLSGRLSAMADALKEDLAR